MNEHSMTADLEPYTTADGRRIGGVMMDLRNITLRFGGVTAIKDISFDIREGEIRAIIGPNGAGKSSMMNVMSGFYVPQEGEVWFRGARLIAERVIYDGNAGTLAIEGPIHLTRPDLAGTLRAFVLRATSRDAAQRPADAAPRW